MPTKYLTSQNPKKTIKIKQNRKNPGPRSEVACRVEGQHPYVFGRLMRESRVSAGREELKILDQSERASESVEEHQKGAMSRGQSKGQANKPQRIQITLGKILGESSSKTSPNKNDSQIWSQRTVFGLTQNQNESLLELQKLKKPKGRQKLTCFSELLRLHDEAYLAKKREIGYKLSAIGRGGEGRMGVRVVD